MADLLYAGPACVEMPVSGQDWQAAVEAARLHVRWIVDTRGTVGSHRFWSPMERTIRAYLCEIGFARWIGLPWEHKVGVQHRPDVGPYEVKTRAYHHAATMDDFDGGNQHVNARSPAKITVFTSCFEATLDRRVFFDGWISKREAARFPLWSRPGERKTHRIPYAALNSPWSLPRLEAA
jgi:hypothetical protein